MKKKPPILSVRKAYTDDDILTGEPGKGISISICRDGNVEISVTVEAAGAVHFNDHGGSCFQTNASTLNLYPASGREWGNKRGCKP